jgi:general secretion pathway protein G
LLEVLLVLVILITLTSSVGYYVLGAQKKAMNRAAVAQMGLFKNMLVDYHMDMGSYPSTDQGLAALSAAPEGSTKWLGPYAEKIPNDPWGNPYQYACNAGTYEVYSLGPDGQDGSGDEVRQP